MDTVYGEGATDIDAGTIGRVRESYDRAVRERSSFFEDFYDELISKRAVYQRLFGDVDMVHQYARLYAGLHKLIEYAEDPAPERLTLIAEVHSSGHLDIQPTHYLDWVDALLATLSISDPKFDADLADDWVTMLMPGIEFMKSWSG